MHNHWTKKQTNSSKQDISIYEKEWLIQENMTLLDKIKKLGYGE